MEILAQEGEWYLTSYSGFMGYIHCDYVDSLQAGAVDIMVLPDTCSHHGSGNVILSRKIDNAVWAINSDDIAKIKEVNTWIATYTESDEYRQSWVKYHKTANANIEAY